MNHERITAEEAIKLYYEDGQPVEFYNGFNRQWVRLNAEARIDAVFVPHRKFRMVIEDEDQVKCLEQDEL
ncbi:hypothetical protein [Jeotgalibacillus salarius]|uniref:Uncharacterized protein n=1 Tax=Jeotgalibacillus salarius TaxID=546023 RepID=A0A4Y8LJN4_9BACL|nr:hypothetical protein [Jeotgalibacillus salarius]TFE02862.1 hypothetical protein E2626_03380 [Jeotgalibacillus salarius]